MDNGPPKTLQCPNHHGNSIPLNHPRQCKPNHKTSPNLCLQQNPRHPNRSSNIHSHKWHRNKLQKKKIHEEKWDR